MIIHLTPEKLEDMKQNGIFVCDGCACGDFVYQLEDKLWLSVYRSCRKSSMTPDEKLWHLHEVVFYESVMFDYYTYNGEEKIDSIAEFGTYLEELKLNEEDQKELMEMLKEKTKEHWKNEYRNED